MVTPTDDEHDGDQMLIIAGAIVTADCWPLWVHSAQLMDDKSLDNDPRWRRLTDQDWICPCCGIAHGGLLDLACGKPEQWTGSEEKVPNAEASSSRHFLSDDFCILNGEHFFVRAVLNIPVVGSGGHHFGYGIWSTVSEKNFRIYIETFDSGQQAGLGPWFGWFSNRLPGYPNTLNLKCHVHPRPKRQRPWIELEATDHPLAIEQRSGITLDRALEIYALNGHDIAHALLD